MANNNPAPISLGLTTLPTPNTIDVLFVENRDARVPLGKTVKYGAAHPDKSKYPNHKLVYISDESPENVRQFYYACDWDKQDEYNLEISYPYGRTDAPRYTRTYVLPRDGYQPLAFSSVDPFYPNAILVGQEMQRIGVKELDSLYVKVTRIYDDMLAATEMDGLTSSTADGTEYGISITYPYSGGSESVSYPMVTWRIPIKHSAYTAAADLSACPIVGYTNLSIVDQEYEQDPQKPNTGAWVRRYEKIPSRVNYSPSTHPQWGKVHVFSFRAAESYTLPVIGSSFTYSATAYPIIEVDTSPAKGSVISVRVTCSPVSATGTLRTDQDIDQIFCVDQIVNQKVPSSTTIPSRGSFYSNGSKNGYVLDSSLADDDGTNATLTVKLASTNVVNITEYEMDEATGEVFPKVQRYYIGTTQPVGIDVDNSGRFTVTKRLGCNYWVSTTSSVTTLPGPLAPITWYGTEVYNWPKVLKTGGLHKIYEGENHNTTPVAKSLVALDMKAAYRGACAAKYEEWWQKLAPSIPALVEMIDVGVNIDGVYKSINIEPCLHDRIEYTEINTGGDDRYEDFNLRWTYAPTNYKDWPAFVFFFDVARLGGGFRCKRTTIYRPNNYNIGGGLTYNLTS
jgi:hypothetical protein